MAVKIPLSENNSQNDLLLGGDVPFVPGSPYSMLKLFNLASILPPPTPEERQQRDDPDVESPQTQLYNQRGDGTYWVDELTHTDLHCLFCGEKQVWTTDEYAEEHGVDHYCFSCRGTFVLNGENMQEGFVVRTKIANEPPLPVTPGKQSDPHSDTFVGWR